MLCLCLQLKVQVTQKQDGGIHLAFLFVFAAQGGGDPEAETGARLTCHLLLRLLRTGDAPAANTAAGCLSSSPTPTMYVRSTCDLHLLEAARDCLTVGAVVAVLQVRCCCCGCCHHWRHLWYSGSALDCWSTGRAIDPALGA